MAFWPFKTRDWATRGIAYKSQELAIKLAFGLSADRILLRDNDYRAISLEDFQYLMMRGRKIEQSYVKDIFDCDDYSICFVADLRRQWANSSRGKQALAFGYAEIELENSKFHALIWQLDDSGNINYIEPQTNDIFKGKIISVRLIEG